MTSRSTLVRGAWITGLLGGLLLVGCSQSEPTAPPTPTPTPPPTAIPAPAPAPVPEADPAIGAADEPAAIVNGHTITVAELRDLFDQYVGPHRQQVSPEQLDVFWQAQLPGLLETAIAQYLVRDAIRQEDISIDAEAIDHKLLEINEQIPEDETLEELTGRDSDQIRDDIREMLALEQLMDGAGLAAGVPTDAQVQAYYDEHQEEFRMPETVQARHILLKVDQDADAAVREEKRTRLAALRAQLLDGADFETLAREHSDCPSGQRGGDLGTFGRGQMVPPFEAAAFTQEPGAIGDLIETDFGFHIVQVMQRDGTRDISIDDVRERISERLQHTARRDQYNQLLKQLRAKADIQYLVP